MAFFIKVVWTLAWMEANFCNDFICRKRCIALSTPKRKMVAQMRADPALLHLLQMLDFPRFYKAVHFHAHYLTTDKVIRRQIHKPNSEILNIAVAVQMG